MLGVATAGFHGGVKPFDALGGTNSLGENAVAQLAFDGITHDQVDAAAQDLLQPPLNPEEVEKSAGLVEFDEQVDVTLRAGLPTRHRPEQVERAHAEAGEFGSCLGKPLQDLVACHAVILGSAT